jgi:hypothetical protein
VAWHFSSPTDKVWWVVPGVPIAVGCIAVWFKATIATLNTPILTYWNGISRNGFILNLNNPSAGKLKAGGEDSSVERLALNSTTATLNNGSPHHAAFNFNRNSGGANALFIDGVSEATGNSSAAWNTASGGFFMEIGDQSDAFWASVPSDVWEIGYWNVQLNADEIAALAKGFSPKLIRPSALLAYMPLVRDAHEIRQGLAINSSAGSVGDQGRVIGGAV